ncbi:MAG: FtsX-like permease family protein [bacterium]
MKKTIIYLALAFSAFMLSAVNALAVGNQFAIDTVTIAAGPHRLTGSPEYNKAADYIKSRLKQIGVQVVEQPYPTLSLTDPKGKCYLQIEGLPVNGKFKLDLQPMRPDGIITPSTLPEGITGEIVYAGNGDLESYGKSSPAGKIVVLNYNSGAAWLRAFRLGSKAVIFVKDGVSQSWQSHYVESQANFPRYYYEGNKSDLRNGMKVTIHAAVKWKYAKGRNIFAFIKGSNPVFEGIKKPEVLLISANLDTWGEVPFRTPGARGAANCASVLALAEFFKQNRPRRDILLAFFDGQSNGHMGSGMFYRALETKEDLGKLETRKKSYDNEVKFNNKMLGILQNTDQAEMLNNASKLNELIRRMRVKAQEKVELINIDIELWRKQGLYWEKLFRNPLTHSKVTKEEEAYVGSMLEENKRMWADKEIEKKSWNDLRKMLAHNDWNVIKKDSKVADRLAIVVDDLIKDISSRGVELDDINQQLIADQQLNGLIGKSWISLHTSLLFGDNTSRWGVIIGGDSSFHNNTNNGDNPGLYAGIQGTLKTVVENMQKKGIKIPDFEMNSVDGAITTKMFQASPLVHSGEIAGHLGVFNFVFGTIQENLAREGTPDDVIPLLDITKIQSQQSQLALLLKDANTDEGLSQNRSFSPDQFYYGPKVDSSGKIDGPTITGVTQGSSMPTKPMTGAVVSIALRPLTFEYNSHKIPAFNNYQVFMSDMNSNFYAGPLQADPANNLHDGFAVTYDDDSQVEFYSDLSSSKLVKTRLNLYMCKTQAIVDGEIKTTNRTGAIVPTPQVDAGDTTVLQGMTNSPLDVSKSYFATQDGVTFWYCERRIEDIKLFFKNTLVSLVNGPELAFLDKSNEIKVMETDEKTGKKIDISTLANGDGISLLHQWEFPASALRSASDIWRLNAYRLSILQNSGVMNNSIEELHGRSEDLWRLASKEDATVAQREAFGVSSFFASRSVYEDTNNSLQDLVRAVLILLALAIPFAFALERLLIGATNIYRQISWFIVFFFSTFIILWLIHPAFKVSNQPVVIFLAFALMLLSGLVIVIMMQKFEAELKVLQGMTSTVHSADVSRFSTMMAAMSMGISTMRRRPLRTALTALTITLLTFTILNFASFDTQTGIVTLFSGSAKYAGVYLHKVNWGTINPETAGVISGRWGNDSTIVRRYWIVPDATTPGVLITKQDATVPKPLKGVLGIDAKEIEMRDDLQLVFGDNLKQEDLNNGIFITKAMADPTNGLGVNVGDYLIVSGQKLKVLGLIDPAVIARTKDMDNSSILPVDFSATSSTQPNNAQQQNQNTGSQVLAALQNSQDWIPLPTDQVVVVSNATALKLGASLRAVCMYTKTTDEATKIAEDMARILPMPVIATRPDGVYIHVLAPTMKASGVKDLFFPILLGAMVVFGTMLGSVADREKEIYTFSALGLAPAHVATLFFAEALVYAFIGGMGGYLLAQSLMKILMVLRDFGLVSVPEMNYSSLNAIVTILIVMLTVLISAIYPAFKASRSANPGVLRAWKSPVPDGDNFHIVFPFTVSQYDITGVVSFLKEHFENFSDTGLGTFMAQESSLILDESNPGIKSIIALAPFDLGVTQTFALRSTPSEIPGIDEVMIDLTRLSGQQKDWQRLNKVLLDDLRKQFLIWRALPQETMEMYRQQTLVAMKEYSDNNK